jgi:hypothetical protein
VLVFQAPWAKLISNIILESTIPTYYSGYAIFVSKSSVLCMLKAHGEISSGGHPRIWKSTPVQVRTKRVAHKRWGKTPPTKGGKLGTKKTEKKQKKK